MAYVTPEQVKAIITVDTKTYPDLSPFIDAAHSLVVTYVEEYARNNGLPLYSSEKTTQIELWLSAHCITAADNRSLSEGAGSVSESYSLTTGLMLLNSHYGQMAIALDSNGGLASMSKKAEEGKAPLDAKLKFGVAFVG